MSAIWLFAPAIDVVSKSVDLWVCCLSARARRRWPAVVDFEALSLVAQATVGVLSQKRAMCLCFRLVGEICSSTNQARRRPAISRSEFDMRPFLLALLMEFCISSGHWMRHTVGSIEVDPPNHTPPAPVLQAST